MSQKILAFVLISHFVFLNCDDLGEFEKLHLKNVKSLTFFANATTINNISQQVPQLFCWNDTESQLCVDEHEPKYMTCENLHFNTKLEEPKWLCDEDILCESMTFKRSEVLCEKFENSSDTVIAGSCYLNYTLKHSFIDNHQKVEFGELLAIILFSLLVAIVLVGALCSNHLSCIFNDETMRNSNGSRDPIHTISGLLDDEISNEDSTSMIDYASIGYSTSCK